MHNGYLIGVITAVNMKAKFDVNINIFPYLELIRKIVPENLLKIEETQCILFAYNKNKNNDTGFQAIRV